VTAIGTKKFDLLVPEFLIVTIELAFALRAGHPKDFGHGCFPLGPSSRVTARDLRKISPFGRNDKRVALRAWRLGVSNFIPIP
jgi:hypothetical protein